MTKIVHVSIFHPLFYEASFIINEITIFFKNKLRYKTKNKNGMPQREITRGGFRISNKDKGEKRKILKKKGKNYT